MTCTTVAFSRSVGLAGFLQILAWADCIGSESSKYFHRIQCHRAKQAASYALGKKNLAKTGINLVPKARGSD